MSSKFTALLGVMLAVNILCFSSTASASQFYVGAQATNLSSHLDYGNGSESYNLSPTRIELGWKDPTFYWAIHILTSGKDTDIDPFGDTYEMKLNTSYGIFLGLNSPNFYLSLGLQSFDTIYRLVPTTTQDESNILTLGFQLGIQHEIVPNLSLYADFSYYAGKADYPTFYTANPDFSVHGFAAGLKYAF